MNCFIRIACATICGALLSCWPALAKMDKAEEEQFNELMQAGRALETSKDLDRACDKFDQAKQLAVKGQDHKREIDAKSAIGQICLEKKDFAAAEVIYKEALTTCEANSDLGDGLLASCLYDLSNVFMRQKKDREAQPYFERCLQLTKKSFSANHPVLGTREGEYGALLKRLGETAEGNRLMAESQTIIDNFMGDMSLKIKKAWQPPPENFSYRVEVSYDVFDHGKVGRVTVSQSSGSAAADRAAVAAIRNGAPFSDITSTDLDYKVSLLFNLEYNHHQKTPATAGGADSAETVTHSTIARQSREVRQESEARLKEEKEKSDKLKAEIESLLQAKSYEPSALADMYVQYAKSLIVEGENVEAANQLTRALQLKCFDDHKKSPALCLLIALGHSYLIDPQLGKAEETLKEVIDAGEFSQTPLAMRKQALEDYGNWLAKNHKYAEAQDYYTRAREMKE